jgi:hypothetical protein
MPTAPCPRCHQECILSGTTQSVVRSILDMSHPTGGYDLWRKIERFHCAEHGEFAVAVDRTVDKAVRYV